MLKKFVKLKLRYQAYLEEESKIRKKSFIILAKVKTCWDIRHSLLNILVYFTIVKFP